ncbi:FAS1-like dehydratase domain-containing protein [Marinobacterium aestuariivivens]|uniref:MaoC family dehydratase N-terminal domain-containing protein n=1 Tax=Marinobacterium aestuariivivens TaxID=1698799 RepID=A0ABW2A9Q1_9GAMM
MSLPRRMWAGSRIRYHQPLRLGETVHRLSTVADVSAKEGKSGSLVFLTLRHEYEGSNGLALTEEQDLVYRDNPPPGAPVPAPKQAPDNADWSRRILPDPTLLFRYSAVTLNAHRIHYDFPYVTETEGYPGLIVHGQLIATLLLHLAQSNRPNGEIEEFEFRAMSPLFCNQPFFVEGVPQASGREGDLWARTEAGGLAMKADIRWR